MSTQSEPGMVYTFYSYKGGVGRSMALANVASLLARWGSRVLIIDWDLEAPGIEKYFANWISHSNDKVAGVVDIIESYASDGDLGWRECLIHVHPSEAEAIDILPAGKDLSKTDGDRDYVKRLRSIKWEALFQTKGLGHFFEDMRDQWRSEYDFILIDSRTGITDIGGICTIHLPDVLVSFFTANEQSLQGVRDVMFKARNAHTNLPVDRRRLLLIPVPSRDESGSEYQLGEEWRQRFAEVLKDYIKEWLPRGVSAASVMDYLKIPYFAYWSFGERIPVLEESDPDNPKTLAYAYQPLARLIFSDLSWDEARRGTESTEAARNFEAETAKAKLESEQLQDKRVREERITSEASYYLDNRFAEIVEQQKIQNKIHLLQMLSGIICLFGSLAYFLYGIYVYISFYTEHSDKVAFLSAESINYSGIGPNLTISIALFLLAFIVMSLNKPQEKYMLGKARVSHLLKLKTMFKVNFPGPEPAEEFNQFVSEVETEFTGAQSSNASGSLEQA